MKANNGRRYEESTKNAAISLRQSGLTHREIALKLEVSTSTAHEWCIGIVPTKEQKTEIEKRRRKPVMSPERKDATVRRLKEYWSIHRYTKEKLLERIQEFYRCHGRIPLKREFNAWGTYAAHFGSWNQAIVSAGFSANPVLFAKKFIALDGHSCDSFSEKIIDDWLGASSIAHTRHQNYGNSRFTVDFSLQGNVVVEFFGLAGIQENYDRAIKEKRKLARHIGWKLIEVYPNDLYPNNKLAEIILPYVKMSAVADSARV